MSSSLPGNLAPVPREGAIALRAGTACGLGLFGIDVIESPDGPVVAGTA